MITIAPINNSEYTWEIFDGNIMTGGPSFNFAVQYYIDSCKQAHFPLPTKLEEEYILLKRENSLWSARIAPFIAYDKTKEEAVKTLELLAAYFNISTKGVETRMEKPLLTCIFRENPATPEGKYLVTRRDSSIVKCPSFVLLAPDPYAADTIRDYANRVERSGKAHPGFIESLRRWADTYDKYRQEHGEGDPERGKHRVDDPETLEKMRQGMSA